MRKLFYILPFILISIGSTFSSVRADFTTILIIIEEQENDNFVMETTPFSDGIFDALWNKEWLFFDIMNILF